MMFCPWCDGGMTLGRTLLGALLFLFVFAAILALLGLAVWLIIRASRGAGGGGYVRSGASRPLEILKERLARGEITREEYEHLRRDLET